jgi:hypothetical protein
MQAISRLHEELLASHEGFCSMEPVSQEEFSHSTSVKLKSVEECNTK